MIVSDITTSMPAQCQRNRDAEAQRAAWKEAHTTDGVLCYSAADLLDSPDAPQYVAIDADGWIAIDRGEGWRGYYDFDGARITTPLDLLEWVHHLCGKVWMDTQRVEQFIAAVCRARKWPAKIEG